LLLDFDGTPSRESKHANSVKGLVAMALIGAVAVLGSTLAANITLNSGSLEFGQGIATATACDSNGITMTPKASYTNTASGSFSLASIAFSGIDDNCKGDLWTINAYDNSSATPLKIATVGAATYDVATFVVSATLGQSSSYITTGGVDMTSANANKLEIGFKGTQATSGSVYKITLQTN
jgi:N-methylhydantoinase B/oxoprolinase/acetone carboxylase alpha subunit